MPSGRAGHAGELRTGKTLVEPVQKVVHPEKMALPKGVCHLERENYLSRARIAGPDPACHRSHGTPSLVGMPPMTRFHPQTTALNQDACERALDARDPRFDGLFFVGITTTRIYCRPVCPARVSHTDRRRFFDTAGAAERAGFRPCLRCRPELAPGRAPVDAVSRLVRAATSRIEAGALNGHSVDELATELGVSGRHLRRVLEREFGVSPGELAQTHRLLLAKRLLADTCLPVTRIAFASGFQSLRRFNAAFREQYRMSPTTLRRSRVGTSPVRGGAAGPDGRRDTLRLTLAYRAPFDWRGLLVSLARDAIPGVECTDGHRYCRTVALDGRVGVVQVEDAGIPEGAARRPRQSSSHTHLDVELSSSLVPVIMTLISRLRRLFDLDAEPLLIDAHLSATGMADLVRRRRGIRIPGSLDPFDAIVGQLVRSGARSVAEGDETVRRVVAALGEPVDTGHIALTHVTPTAARIAEAGATGLLALGMQRRAADTMAAVAAAVADGSLRLANGHDVNATYDALVDLGVDSSRATMIVQRALYWPDAFPVSDPSLLRSARAGGARMLARRAERWRPWRAYAATHLSLAVTH